MKDTEALRHTIFASEDKDHAARLRSLPSHRHRAITVLAVVWAAFQLAVSLFPVLDAVKLRSCHVLFLMTMAFLLYPSFIGGLFDFLRNNRRATRKKSGSPTLFDTLCITVAFASFGRLFLVYDEITLRGGWLLPVDYATAAAGIAVAFALALRVVPNLAVPAALFFAYLFFGEYIAGPFGHTGFSWKRVAEHMFWGTQGLLGIGVGVSASYIFMFILFAAFLRRSGFSAFINDLSAALVGRAVGGPAKVAVLASALMGMMNGSAVANVAATGSVTIPLMRRAGYRPAFAAAVEAAASTGGQFTPPVMGAVGFVMAEFLAVPYSTVMAAAAIPAFLYYLALLAAVHLEARRLGLEGFRPEHIPAAGKVLKERGYLLLPPVVLVGLIVAGFTPLFAACIAIGASVVASWCSPVGQGRMGPVEILRAMDEGARDAVSVGAACVIIGLIIGTVSLTGLGFTLSQEMLRGLQPGQIYLAGLLVMLVSVVLGMGVPGVAAYVIVASVAAPILEKVGAAPLAAHMFCLIYACLSNITPPVAMSSYVAAGIARAGQTKTSLSAVKLGAAGFILPFFFLDNPLLLYSTSHDLLHTLWAIISASVGVVSLAAALQGYLLGPCSAPIRLLTAAAAGLAIHPGLPTDTLGLLLFTAVCVFQWRNQRPLHG